MLKPPHHILVGAPEVMYNSAIHRLRIDQIKRQMITYQSRLVWLT